MLLRNARISLIGLIKNKLYAIIYIGGLTLSLTILISLYINTEFNVNKDHTNFNQLYSLNYKVTNKALSSNRFDEKIIINNENLIDSSFLDIFSAKINKKKINEFLLMDKSILISESITKKIYEEEQEEAPLNKTFKIDNRSEHVIEVELEDNPSNSSSTYDLIISSPSTFFIPIYNNKL